MLDHIVMSVRVRRQIKRFYHTWYDMKNRCDNPKHRNFHRYGGRGIRYAAGWQHLEGFYLDMFSSWKPGLTLDRIDNDGPYCKQNCRWLSKSENIRKAWVDKKADPLLIELLEG